MFAEQERHLSETFSGAEHAQHIHLPVILAPVQLYSAATNGEHALARLALVHDHLRLSVSILFHQADKLGKLRGRQMKEERKPRGFEFRARSDELYLDLRIIVRSIAPL